MSTSSGAFGLAAHNRKKSSRKVIPQHFFGGVAVAAVVLGCAWTVYTNVFGASVYPSVSSAAFEAPAVKNLPRSILKNANWVKPALLCEASFTEWTDDGHIRHPVFQGLREDKKPQEVTMEKPVVVKNNEVVTNRGREKRKSDRIDVLGVSVSHPDRVIFEKPSVTKGELAEFYAAAAQWILKDIASHPVSLLRCPEGTPKPAN